MSDGTVFVVDDDLDIRRSLERMLQAEGFHVETYHTGQTFLERYNPDRPGCLLLDVCLPHQSGLDLVASLSRCGIRIPVVFMTAHADVATAVRAMKAGAIEFLQKPLDRETLPACLHRALEIDRNWRSASADYARMDGRLKTLSDDERLTLELVVEGNSNKMIARRLAITERAVERRRARIMRKLGARSLPEALQLAITHRLLSELRSPLPQRLPASLSRPS